PGMLQLCPGMKLRFVRRLREFVPRAYGQAVVAAIDAVSDCLAKFARDVSLVLDREIGDAAARIEFIGRGKRVRRTDVETAPALPAMVCLRRVRINFECRENGREKKP